MSSILWLLDRSRIVDGRGFCGRARLLGYHIGPNGYGIQRKATKLPLMTGIVAHDGLAPILEWCRDHDDLIVQALQQVTLGADEILLPVPSAVVRGAVKKALDKYQQVVTVRGFAYLSDQEEVQAVIREQQYLIEGLIWAWCLEVLPRILLRGRVVEVEHDDVYVFDCTCGLGDGIGTKADHEGRECGGKGLMCRPDFLIETRTTLELEYHEFKTTGMDSVTFRDKWEVMIQMFAATLDAERRTGKHVQSVYIHGLIKGKREGDYNPETGKRDGFVRQNSIFCYGYRRPAMPPMESEEWAAQYEYYDNFENKNKRLPKAYKKAGVWELPDALIPADDPEMTKAEFWAKWIPPDARKKQLVIIGPLSRQTLMVDHFLEESKGEETRWQEGLWQLYELGQTILAESYPQGLPDLVDPTVLWWEVVWPDPRFQNLMDRLFPRSYECRRYGGRNRCQFEDPCLFRESWANPTGSGAFIERVPHHTAELQQMIDRGLTPADAGLMDDIETELP